MLKVSIITVVYNSENTVRDTLESVLRQDYPYIEYIVIDGNSSDRSLQIINEYKDRISMIVSEADKGIYDAMNKGIKMATGDVVGLLNSDDLFASDNVISRVAETFASNPDVDGVHGDLYYVKAHDVNSIVRYWHSSEYRYGAFMHGWHPAHPTLYVRRGVYEKYGAFDLRFPLSADFELMLRFFECCQIRTMYINMVMVRMRMGGATSRNLSAILQGIRQCKRAFRANGLCPPLFYPFYRLCPKLLQYVRRRHEP